MHTNLVSTAHTYLEHLLDESFMYDPRLHKAVILFDTQNELTQIITKAYKQALPSALSIDFDASTKEEILNVFDTLKEEDLVVLIQTSNFRLNDYRIRMNLFKKGLKVIEHTRLYRNRPEMWQTYIESLRYNKEWYQQSSSFLKTHLGSALRLEYISGNNSLVFESPLEDPKLNIGDYSDMKNTGGSFPIGEVFTEAKDITSTNGSVSIYGFADQTFKLHFYEPFLIHINDGVVEGWSDNTPQNFIELVEHIRTIERPIIRELGFGLNRAITRETPLGDITAFERNLGLHFSMGEKHNIYKKEGITKSKTRFHVDLYLDVDEVRADTITIFKDRTYTL